MLVNHGLLILSMVFASDFYQERLDKVLVGREMVPPYEKIGLNVGHSDIWDSEKNTREEDIFGLREARYPIGGAGVHDYLLITIERVILYVSENWHRIQDEMSFRFSNQDKKMEELSRLIQNQQMIIGKLNTKLLNQQKLLDQLQVMVDPTIEGCPPPPVPIPYVAIPHVAIPSFSITNSSRE